MEKNRYLYATVCKNMVETNDGETYISKYVLFRASETARALDVAQCLVGSHMARSCIQ